MPVTRNRGPGPDCTQLPQRCERAPSAWVSATNTSSSAGAWPSTSAYTLRTGPSSCSRLVDEVAAEVQQGAAARGRRALLPALEARLEPRDPAQRAVVDQRPDGQEVGVPPPVLVDRQQDAEPLGEVDGRAGVRCGERERLVDDDRETEFESLLAQRDVRVGRRRDGDGLDPGGLQPGQVVDHGRARMLAVHQRATLRGPGGDGHELALVGRGDERGVEPAGTEAVADQPEPHGIAHAPR